MATEKLRAGKIGIGHEVEAKMEQNYDREEAAGTPTHVVNWVNGVMDGEPGFEKCPQGDWKAICTHLRNGVILCQMINKLLKQDGKGTVKVQTKAASPFVALTNIENFNDGCLKYGVAKEFTFQSGDLWELRKGPFLNVINCVHSLGFVANGKGVSPKYEGDLKKND